MTKNIVAEVRALQASMAEAVGGHFGTTQLDDMRVLIRLSVEHFYVLQTLDLTVASIDTLTYMGESAFSGLDSFAVVANAYRSAQWQEESRVRWREMSPSELKQQFLSLYPKFLAETAVAPRCRLLLDLFILQILLAVRTYS